jgi:hypothetical protein
MQTTISKYNTNTIQCDYCKLNNHNSSYCPNIQTNLLEINTIILTQPKQKKIRKKKIKKKLSPLCYSSEED